MSDLEIWINLHIMGAMTIYATCVRWIGCKCLTVANRAQRAARRIERDLAVIGLCMEEE